MVFVKSPLNRGIVLEADCESIVHQFGGADIVSRRSLVEKLHVRSLVAPDQTQRICAGPVNHSPNW